MFRFLCSPSQNQQNWAVPSPWGMLFHHPFFIGVAFFLFFKPQQRLNAFSHINSYNCVIWSPYCIQDSTFFSALSLYSWLDSTYQYSVLLNGLCDTDADVLQCYVGYWIFIKGACVKDLVPRLMQRGGDAIGRCSIPVQVGPHKGSWVTWGPYVFCFPGTGVSIYLHKSPAQHISPPMDTKHRPSLSFD